MKKTIFLALSFFALQSSAVPLKSDEIRKAVCTAVVEKILGFGHKKFEQAEKECFENADIDVSGEIKNKQLNTTIGLVMGVRYIFEKRDFAGEVIALKDYRTEKDGTLVSNGWFVSEITADVSDERGTEAILNEIAEGADTHNGDYSVEKYDTAKFSTKAAESEIEGLLEDWGDARKGGEYDHCSYFTYTDEGTKADLSELENYMGSESFEALEKLKKDGKIKTMVYRTYNTGSSEYCSKYYYFIYTTDGWVLKLYLDFTT